MKLLAILRPCDGGDLGAAIAVAHRKSWGCCGINIVRGWSGRSTHPVG
jgi:hypothetical protein